MYHCHQETKISHTIKRKGAGTTLVKFQSHKGKSRFYKAKTKVKNIRLPDVFLNASTATRVAVQQVEFSSTRISQPTDRKDLLRDAKDKHKDSLVISACSVDGKIFVKMSPSGIPINKNVRKGRLGKFVI